MLRSGKDRFLIVHGLSEQKHAIGAALGKYIAQCSDYQLDQCHGCRRGHPIPDELYGLKRKIYGGSQHCLLANEDYRRT
jgi:hypothetical protein